MNPYQILVALFGLFVSAVSLWAIVAIPRSNLRMKPLWIAGSVFGFIGLGIDWSSPSDLTLLVGIMIPPARFFTAAPGHVILEAGFPVIAAVALAEARPKRG